MYCLKVVAFLGLTALDYLVDRGGKIARKLKGQLFYTELILLFTEGYLEFTIVFFLYFIVGEDRTIVSSLQAAMIGAIVFIFLPASAFWTARYPEDSESFKKRWSIYFESVRDHSFLTRSYYLFFILRRICFISTAFLLKDFPG